MINALEQSDLFKGIQTEIIEDILKHITVNTQSFKKDEILHNQGETCTSLAVIIEGHATIQSISSSGNVLVLGSFKKGDIFAEALLFAKENEYPAEIVAISDVKLIEFTKADIMSMMTVNLKLAENIIALLSDKIVMLKKKISVIEAGSVKQKVSRLLMQKSRQQNSLTIKIASKKQLAEEIGIPRPSLSRELIALKEEGVIDFSLKEIQILNLEALIN